MVSKAPAIHDSHAERVEQLARTFVEEFKGKPQATIVLKHPAGVLVDCGTCRPQHVDAVAHLDDPRLVILRIMSKGAPEKNADDGPRWWQWKKSKRKYNVYIQRK